MYSVTKHPIIIGGVWTGAIDRVEFEIDHERRICMRIRPDHVQFLRGVTRTYTETVLTGSYEEFVARKDGELFAFTGQRVRAGETRTYTAGTYRRVHTVSVDLLSIVTHIGEPTDDPELFLIPTMNGGYEPNPIPTSATWQDAMRHLNPHLRPDGWVSPWPKGWENL
jgi:hypothetical protein